MNTISITGPTGLLKWGYHQAATLASWEIGAGGTTLTAKLVECDHFRVTQAPLTFEVPRPAGAWIWNVITLQIAGETLTASIAPKE